MKLTDYIRKRVQVTASYHPKAGVVARVVTVNRRMRRLTVSEKGSIKLWTVYPSEVQVLPE